MSRLSRRKFLQTSAAASAAFSTFTIAGTKASGKVLGANDAVRIGVCGIKGRGSAHIAGYAGAEGVQVTYLIDVDQTQFGARVKQVQDKGGNTPTTVQDVRKALEDKNLDAISIATCNHTHSLISIWACQAGKDVYVEKPLSHNVFEGRKLVEAAKKYGRIVQHGTQQRSEKKRADEMDALHSGKYGKLLVSKGYCAKPRWSIGFKEPTAPPSTLDFNLWLGPAPQQPYHTNLVHYNWHWFWDTGNGDIGNQGVHQMDVARWGIAGATLPTSVWSLGGRFGYEDQGQTPNTLLTVFEFGDVKLVFETRGLVGKDPKFPSKITNEFYTTEGMIRDAKFYPKNGGEAVSVSGGSAKGFVDGGAFGSFVQCVRTRQQPNCDAEVGHYSSALCHLANISYRLGEPVPFSKQSQALGDNQEVVRSFNDIQANLTGVGVKLAETTYQMGRVLKLDPKAEKFIGDEQANALLTRKYRAPFVVPDVV